MGRFFFMFFILIFTLFSCEKKEEKVLPKTKALLIDKNGNPIPLPTDRILFINFMAYSCGSCMKELPIIKRVLKEEKYKKRFAFIGCVIDATENDLSDKDFPMYTCHNANFVRFPVPGTPTTYIVTPRGKKLIVIFGAITEKNLKEFLDQAIKKYEKIKEKSL